MKWIKRIIWAGNHHFVITKTDDIHSLCQATRTFTVVRRMLRGRRLRNQLGEEIVYLRWRRIHRPRGWLFFQKTLPETENEHKLTTRWNMNSDTHFLVETDRDDTLDSQSPIKYLNGEVAPRKPIARLKALGKQMKAELINGITAVDIKSNNAKD